MVGTEAILEAQKTNLIKFVCEATPDQIKTLYALVFNEPKDNENTTTRREKK